MILRCISDYPSEAQIDRLGQRFRRKQLFAVSVGKEYIALGLDLFMNASVRGTGVYVEILDDCGHLLAVPLCLFEVLDARVSRYWRIDEADNEVTLWPPSFYTPYYHDQLSDDVQEFVEDFAAVYRMLDAEARVNEQPPDANTEDY